MYVYFIKCCDEKGFIKVGVADDVERRCDTLQIGSPYKLIILAKMKCKSRKEAYRTENDIHRYFKKSRLRGEWFSSIDMKSSAEFFNRKLEEESDNPTTDDEWEELESIARCPFV
jgi:predicted GIY-YIG superfamily endonuclease